MVVLMFMIVVISVFMFITSYVMKETRNGKEFSLLNSIGKRIF